MGYEKQNWQDRLVENPDRYRMIQDGEYTTAMPAFGKELQPGTPISAQRLNRMEEGIAAVDRSKVEKTVILPGGTDLNTVVESGFYRLLDSCQNGPTQFYVDHGQLIVSCGGDTLAQIVFNPSDSRMAFRAAKWFDTDAGVWSPWKEVAEAPKMFYATFPVEWWVQDSSRHYICGAPVSGILATDTPICDLVFSGTSAAANEAEKESYGYVDRIDTLDGEVWLKCFEDKPTVALTIGLKVMR